MNKILHPVESLPDVEVLPDRFRLAQTDRGDITLSDSKSATSSEIASC